MKQIAASQTLAAAAAQTQWADLPERIRDHSADLFLDTLAVWSAGLGHTSYAAFAESLTRETGCASVPGCPHGVPVTNAIQINAGATTVLQYQDGHRLGRGHPVSHIAPTLLALAEETEAAASDVFAALIAGYEVGARIGVAMGGLDPALHDTGTWSCIATAVAAAHLLNGTEAVLAAAIESAAATALMPYRDLPIAGATAHHLYVGLGATTGLMAARASIAGLEPLVGTLETFFMPRAGADAQLALLTNGIDGGGQWSAYEIDNAYFKVHPTCAHLHGANDALASLLRTGGFVTDDIASIEIATYGSGLAFDNPSPANDLAARFSQAASAAIMLCFGALDEDTLTDTHLLDPRVRALMERISVGHDPALDAQYPQGRPARVTLRCKDGRALTETIVHPLGDHTNPAPPALLRQKAQRLLAFRFGNDNAQQVVAAFDAYRGGDSVGGLSDALRKPPRL